MTREVEITRFFQFLGQRARPVQIVGKTAIRIAVPDPDQLEDDDLQSLPMAQHLPRTCKGLRQMLSQLVGKRVLRPVFGQNTMNPNTRIFEIIS